ncbi:MAG: hypothetical protein ACFE8B_06695 [Candidatus Hermodarchaeota archaeon]
MINTDEKYNDLNSEGKFPKADGLVGFLVLDKTGLLYFSKVAKNNIIIAQNIFQIAGFISAILIYSEDLIGTKDSGIKLEDINLGNHHLYVCTRENLIFAYFVEKPRITENFKSHIKIIIEKFIEKYFSSCIKDFKGDISHFYKFEEVIDQYFEI